MRGLPPLLQGGEQQMGEANEVHKAWRPPTWIRIKHRGLSLACRLVWLLSIASLDDRKTFLSSGAAWSAFKARRHPVPTLNVPRDQDQEGRWCALVWN